jgi:tripartite motif-containing protein 71
MNRSSNLLWILGMTLTLVWGCGKNAPPTAPTPASNVISYGFSNYLGINQGGVSMNGPNGIGISGNNIWVSNEYGDSMQAWTLGGSLLLNQTSFDGGETFALPNGLAIGPDGFVYIVEGNGHNRIDEFTPTGDFTTFFGSGDLSAFANSVAVNSTSVYVTDNGVVRYFTYTGTGSSKGFFFNSNFGNTGAGILSGSASGVALDGSGNVYVADFGNQRIVKYNPTGVFQQAVTLVQGLPIGVAVDPSGNIFTSAFNTDIQVYSPSGSLLTTFGKGIVINPWQLAFDSNLNLYVSDNGPNESNLQSQIEVFHKN